MAKHIWSFGRLATLLVVLSLLLAACGGASENVASPQPGATSGVRLTGQLDTTFGQGGKISTEMGGTEAVGGMVVQPDGKIVVAGTARPDEHTRPKFTLARYNADGSLDSGFGDGGRVYTSLLNEDYDYSQAGGIALQADGKLVVVGNANNPQVYHTTFAVVRYNTDGSTDASFGDDGRVLTPIYPGTGMGPEDDATGVAIQPDGKIVVAGTTGNYPVDFGAVRYNADGSLDESFGDGGKVVVDLGYDDHANDVKLQADGKILIAGYGGSNPDFAIARLNADGSLDSGFGDGGKVLTEFNGGTDWAEEIAIVPGGKFAVGGLAQIGNPVCGITTRCDLYGFALAQYNADGSLDSNFGDGGKANPGFISTASAYAMIRRADGKFFLAGHVGNNDWALAAFNANGSVDESFGNKWVRTDFGSGIDRAYALALQPDGKLLAAGVATTDPADILDFDFALARYK